MAASDPTRAQIERTLIQQIQNFYRQRIGQRPSKAICQIFDDGLSVILQHTVSPAEQTLLDAGREEFAKRLRSELNEAIKPPLKALIEDIIGTCVVAILIDSDLSSGFSSVTAVVTDLPAVSDPESIPKVNRKKLADSGNET
jgi:uncharacterized protein YbcI